jgi:hypothetical protein
MKLDLIKNAASQSNHNKYQRGLIESVTNIIGKEKTIAIFESFDITLEDYDNWLSVIRGYASEQGINIKSKTAFQDVAFAVLENDPLVLDEDVQQAVVNTLWQRQKADQSHSKVQQFARQKEEEEQMEYALRKMSGNSDKSLGKHVISNMHGTRRRPMFKHEIVDNIKSRPRKKWNEEDEEQFLSGAGMEMEEFDDKHDSFSDEDFDDRYGNPDEDDFEFGKDWEDEEFDDDHWAALEQQPHNPNTKHPLVDQESDDWDIDIDQFGDESEDDSFDYEDGGDFEDPRNTDIKARQPTQELEQEETSFQQDENVTYKKDGKQYKVEIPDGPGDMVGIMVGGRIKMVPSKDLECNKPIEDEESTSKQTKKLSFLHDILHQSNSTANLKKLQDEVETAGANAWTTHHAKMPKNEHPKGSLAYKAWDRGVKKAASEIWSPKTVVDPSIAAKKAKQKRK